MAKRFFASEIWEEDWFLDMPNEYKQFWFYMLAKCDHAGVFKVNLRSFRGLTGVSLTSSAALNHINAGKQRLRIIKDDVWLIEDFFVYQYGSIFNLGNRLHESVAKIYEKYEIDLTSIRGLKEVKKSTKTPPKDPNDGVKDKDKDKELGKREEIGGIEDDKGGLGGEAGEKGEGEGRPPTQMLVPQMHSLWQTTFPTYTANREFDYPALQKIAAFIFKTAGVKSGLGDVNQELKVLNTFQLIADQVNRESFWTNKPLSSISTNIQEFYNKIKNPQNGTGNSKVNGAKFDDDKLKQSIAAKINGRK